MDSDTRFVVTPRTVLGVTIALVGVALALDRLGLDPAGRLLRYWPVPLMAIGGLMFVQARDSRERVRGVVFAGIGTWLFLNMQGLVSIRVWQLFWPVVLILVGVNVALQAGRRGRRRSRGFSAAPFDSTASPSDPTRDFARGAAGMPADTSDRVSMFAVMSHVKRAITSAHFRGGDVLAFMGGGQLDLRLATIAPGEEAVLDIVTVMGGVEIYAPSHWEISTPIFPFMGGVDDKRLPPLPTDAGGPRREGPAPRLVLQGFVMMGGVVIK